MYRPLPLFKEVPTKQRYDYRGGGCLKWLGSIDEPGFQRIREGLEELFNSMPASSRDGYRDRLGNPADSEFFSTYFEMWCYAELKSRGWNVEEATSVDGGSKPDWSVVLASGGRAIVECKVCLESQAYDRNQRRLRTWMASVLRKLQNRHIRICISQVKYGKESPPADELARKLDKHVENLQLEELVGYGHGHEFEFSSTCGQWSFRCDIRLAESELSDNSNFSDFVEVVVGDFGVDRGDEQFSDVLREKRKQHSASGQPTVLCVGWNRFENKPSPAREREVVQSEICRLSKKGVVAVIMAHSVYPWNQQPPEPVLYCWGDERSNELVQAWSGQVQDVQDER